MVYEKARRLKELLLGSFGELSKELLDGGVLRQDYISGLEEKVKAKVERAYDQLHKEHETLEPETEGEGKRLYILQDWNGQYHGYLHFLVHHETLSRDEFFDILEEGVIEKDHHDIDSLINWLVESRRFQYIGDETEVVLPSSVKKISVVFTDQIGKP